MGKYTCDVTGGTANITKEKDDRIRMKHPGANKPWKCPLSDSVEASNTKFNKHLKDKHQVRKCFLYCDCGFTSDNARLVGIHMQYCSGSPPEEHTRKLKCQLCKFLTESGSGLQVHMARKHPEIRNEDLRPKEKNFRWTAQELEFLVETIQKLKKDGVKCVNKVAAELLRNRTEVPIQKIRTKQEYKQAEMRVNERKLINVEDTPRKAQLSKIDTPISVTRTPRILPPVPPTPITGQRRRSLPEVPPLPAGIDRYTSTPGIRKKITTSESTSESVNRMRKLQSIPPSSLCVDSTLNKTSSVSVSLPEMEQTSSENAPELVRWLRQLPHAQADTITDNAAIDQMV